jgi:hypothetical protein
MSITHVVFFGFKPTVSQEQIEDVSVINVYINTSIRYVCLTSTGLQKAPKFGARVHPPNLFQTVHQVSQSWWKQFSRRPCGIVSTVHHLLVTTNPRQNPFTHAFVVEFESAEDRDYYVDKDPAHTEFKKFIFDLLGHIQVVDFEPGNFAYKQ